MGTQRDLDRRQALAGGLSLLGAAALSGCRSAKPTPPAASEATLAAGSVPAARSNGTRLVLVELFGGNDGLTTVVPFKDDAFYRARPTTAIAEAECLKLDVARGIDRGFHPALLNFRERFNQGQLAIVEGVGYPNPVYSHFKSFEIWHTARPEGLSSGDGWIGRLRAGPWRADPRPELVVHVGGNLPYSLSSATQPILAFDTPENFVWVGSNREIEAYDDAGKVPAGGTGKSKADLVKQLRATLRAAQTQSPRILEATGNYQPRAEYPEHEFGRSLRSIAALMNSGFESRVYSVALGNFDTHASEQNTLHAELLGKLDSGLGAFLKDLEGTPHAENTLVLCFSEFGRRVEENFSRGTDHGSAGPMFLLGPMVRGGMHGESPSVDKLDAGGNLIHTVDFRRVYASVLESWFGVKPDLILPSGFQPMDLLRA